MTGLLAYAAAASRPGRVGRGARGERLRVVEVDGVALVVGDGEPLEATELTLRGHDRVVRALVRACDAAIPFRFGTWFPDETVLARDITPRTAELRKALALVVGCDQMTARLFDARRASDPTRPEPSAQAEGARPGSRYLKARAKAERPTLELTTLREAVAPLVRAERLELTGSPPLVATAYHLVERPRVRAYGVAVRKVAPLLAPVRVTVSGPWPAYAFVGGE